jgi:hypothetical protein
MLGAESGEVIAVVQAAMLAVFRTRPCGTPSSPTPLWPKAFSRSSQTSDLRSEPQWGSVAKPADAQRDWSERHCQVNRCRGVLRTANVSREFVMQIAGRKSAVARSGTPLCERGDSRRHA